MSNDQNSSDKTSSTTFSTVSLSDRPDLGDAHYSFGRSAWPEFMNHDAVAMSVGQKLQEYWAADQLSLLVDEKIAAVMNLVPLKVDHDLNKLSDRGLNWGMMKSVKDHERGVAPNALMGVQIVVGKNFRNENYGAKAALAMIDHAKNRGFDYVVLPIRPNKKQFYPLIPMQEYIEWTTPEGLPFDSWLRVHHRIGGEIVKVCHNSMFIRAPLQDWSRWTGQDWPGSGEYIVKGALNPVQINIAENMGRYIEPNIWVAHRIPR